MNTTTTTRGVSEAMVLADAYAESAWNDAVDGVGIRSKQTDEARAALEAALSAEPAAQGDAVAWIDEYGNVFPLGAHSVNGKLSWQDAHKRNWRPLFTAPPAQPAERVPEGMVLVPRDPTESQIKAMQSAWAKKEKDATPLRSTTAMVLYFAALAATPARAGRGVDRYVHVPQSFVDLVRAAAREGTHPRAVPQLLDDAMEVLTAAQQAAR